MLRIYTQKKEMIHSSIEHRIDYERCRQIFADNFSEDYIENVT